MTRLAPFLEGLRRHANRVDCPRPRCLAPAGQVCVMPGGEPFQKQAAHDERVKLADHTVALAVGCRVDADGCGAVAGELCRDAAGHLLDPRHPDHRVRLEVADVWRAPLVDNELKGWPHRMSEETRLARGLEELQRARQRAHALERRIELKGDEHAGELTQHGRMELLDLDRLIDGAPEQAPAVDDGGDDMDYR